MRSMAEQIRRISKAPKLFLRTTVCFMSPLVALGATTDVIATSKTVAPDNTLMQWLFSDAGAGWVFGTVTLIGLIVTLVRRSRPNILTFAEIDKTSLIDVNSRIRDRIQVTYNGQSIARLGHVRAEVFNEGSSTIHNAVLKLNVAEGVRILETSAILSDGSEVGCQSDERQATISVGYINPYRDHRHTLLLSMLVDGGIPRIDVSGGGVGWSLRRAAEKDTPRRRIVAFWFSLVSFLIWLVFALFYESYIESHYGIGRHEYSLRSLGAAMVVILPMAAILGGLWWRTVPRRAKTSKESLEAFRNA
jgi:hypothetical protein